MAVKGFSSFNLYFRNIHPVNNKILNFLAHIYLSFNETDISIGNFIADSVKGKMLKTFGLEIQKGILLHRAIDNFTDAHPIYRKSCKHIFKVHGHYSRVIVDIYYDYFLAKNWVHHHQVPLEQYAANFYKLLASRFNELPPKTQHLLPFMEKHNWLVAYGSLEGIDQILKGMHRRTKFNSKMDLAILDLKIHEQALENDFNEFFQELIIFSKNKLIQLST